MKNIAEILKNAPKGLKLYSLVFGEVEFIEVTDKNCCFGVSIKTQDNNGSIRYFDECGRYSNIGDCVLFPSKEHQTWDNWRGVIIPRCVGSVIVSEYKSVPFRWIITKTGWVSLSTEDRRLTAFYEFCTLNLDSGNDLRFATGEETEQCFNELERQGYKFVDGEVVEKSVNYSGKWVVLTKSMSGVQSRDGAFLDLDEGDVFFCEGMSMFGLCNVVHERSGMEFKIRPSLLREWTIKDAKNGDFIYDEYLDSILILECIVSDYIFCHASVIKSLPNSFDQINNFPNLDVHLYSDIIDKAKFRPATAKEKQLLVRLIRERGYNNKKCNTYMETSVNNKCKAFTSFEQSRKLAEILPLESADMLWEQHGAEPYITIKPWTTKGKSIGCHCLSCWSLTALLDVLPYPSLHKTYRAWRCDTYNEEGEVQQIGEDADNPIDACYEMIIKLHELNLL